MDVDNLISGYSKPCLYLWIFSVHILLKPSLKDFEHKLISMQNECNCMVVYTINHLLELLILFQSVYMKSVDF